MKEIEIPTPGAETIIHPDSAHAHAEHAREDAHDHEHGELETTDLIRIGLVAIAVAASWADLWKAFAPFDVIALVATIIGGYPIFREAFESIRERRMTMELSMTLALAAACAIGEFFTALVIVLFVLIAEVLEGMTVQRGRRAVQDLLDYLPATVQVRGADGEREVRYADVRTGDIVVVRPGGHIPVDGTVLSGHSFVDQAALTGESTPAEKFTGSEVFAGSINQSGALDVLAASVGRDTAYGKIVEAVERAEHSRAPVQRTADRFAGYLVYFALACALLTFLLSRDVRATISVIIVAGACGIAAGTPLAILGAIGRAAREGAVIKGGIHLETLWRLDTVVLDKTGTLTLGQPKVVEMDPAAGVSLRQLVEAAAIAESPSEHPLGKAMVQKAKQLGYPVKAPEHFEYTPGRGVFCLSNGHEIMAGSQSFLQDRGIINHFGTYEGAATEIYVGRDRTFLGTLRIRDTIRGESAGAIRELKKMGLETVLLTGDSPAVTSSVARELNIDQFHAGLLPHEKVTKVRELQVQGKTIAMVGDGINDAPALVQASVGVAMGSGTDVARESADILLIGNDLLKFVHTIGIARRCRGIILFNFVGTLAVDSVGVGLAAFGLLNPLLAALIHVVSELAFIGNSARMLPGPRHNQQVNAGLSQ